MGEGHSHGAGATSRRLIIALGLTSTFLVVEVVGAVVFKSLALLSDAAHMMTDVAALAIALAAIKIGERKADDLRTFGYRRFEILAATFNAVLLFFVAGYVLYEGVIRLFSPEPVGSTGMLIVASFGLVVNLISMRLLASGADGETQGKKAPVEGAFSGFAVDGVRRDPLFVAGRSERMQPCGQGDNRQSGRDHRRRQDHADVPVQKVQDIACHDAPSQDAWDGSALPNSVGPRHDYHESVLKQCSRFPARGEKLSAPCVRAEASKSPAKRCCWRDIRVISRHDRSRLPPSRIRRAPDEYPEGFAGGLHRLPGALSACIVAVASMVTAVQALDVSRAAARQRIFENQLGVQGGHRGIGAAR